MSAADTLVVGHGSIGTRHVRLLQELGRRVATVSRRGAGDFTALDLALEKTAADYVVIANETSAHESTLHGLAAADFRGRVLVEKPLFAKSAALPAHRFAALFVGYNLRFHPILLRMKTLLAHESVLGAVAYAGQHLEAWRPGRDHRDTYSARNEYGGGVLRDLSHELDYLLWIFGPCRRLTARVQSTGTLGIGSEDCAALLMEQARCPTVSLQLNYHHRPARRTFYVNTKRHSFEADLITGQIRIDGVTEEVAVERDETYRAMHRAALSGGDGLCGAEEGLAVVGLIEAIERASENSNWVTP